MDQNKERVLELTRKQLYEQVWTIPMQTLADQYGLSDVGLAKICRRHHVPHPSRGYWAKRAHGKPVPQPKLQDIQDAALQVIRIAKPVANGQSNDPLTAKPAYDADIAQLLEKARQLPHVEVPDRISHYHPLIQAHRASRKERHVLYYQDRKPTLNIEVTESCLTRAYQFLDTLFKTIERAGGRVSVEKVQWKDTTYVVFADEQVATIRIREKLRQVKHESNKNDLFYSRKYDRAPTGLLVLDSWPDWRKLVYACDTEGGRRIEQMINRLIIDFIDLAQQARIQARRRAAEEKERRERELKRMELRRKQEAEQGRVNQLVNESSYWEKAQRIRAFLHAAQETAMTKYGRIDKGSQFDVWFQWARQQADRMDPLTPSPPSILDEKLDGPSLG